VNSKDVTYQPTAEIIVNPRPEDFKINMKRVFVDIRERCKTVLLSINFKENSLPTSYD
jgi:hypothetical protein